LQKLKTLQHNAGGSVQLTVDSCVDSEVALTRMSPEGASSNSVGPFCHCCLELKTLVSVSFFLNIFCIPKQLYRILQFLFAELFFWNDFVIKIMPKECK